jgi:hypothetical protein
MPETKRSDAGEGRAARRTLTVGPLRGPTAPLADLSRVERARCTGGAPIPARAGIAGSPGGERRWVVAPKRATLGIGAASMTHARGG